MKHPATETIGNFDMGEWFGAVQCRHGHPTRLFNVGRNHYVACDTCRTYVAVGSNLMSCWCEGRLKNVALGGRKV